MGSGEDYQLLTSQTPQEATVSHTMEGFSSIRRFLGIGVRSFRSRPDKRILRRTSPCGETTLIYKAEHEGKTLMGLIPVDALGEPLINFYNPPSTIPIVLYNLHYTADPDLFPPPLNHNCPQCQRDYESFHTRLTYRDSLTGQLDATIHTTTDHTNVT